MTDQVIALIPAFNEERRVGEVVTKTKPHVTEVVVVDDGSVDRTAEVARAAGAVVFTHKQNRGKGAAINTALDYFEKSPAEFGVFLDADGQHDPNEIPKFVAAARTQPADVVVGTRMGETHGMPMVRRLTNQFTSWITSKLARQRVPDSQCGYRLVRRSVLPHLELTSSRFETETEMLIQAGRAGLKIANVPIRTIYGVEARASHIRPWRDTVRFFKLAAKYW